MPNWIDIFRDEYAMCQIIYLIYHYKPTNYFSIIYMLIYHD